MSASPSCTPPRRPLHERSDSENNRLGIRLVSYSPPFIGSSPNFRPLSYADANTETNTEPWPRCSSPLAPSSPYYESPSPGAAWKKIGPFATPDYSKRRSRLTTPELSSPWRPLADTDADNEPDTPEVSFQPPDDVSPCSSPSSRASSRPPSRRKVISVHADKTFSVHPQELSASTSSRNESIWSNQQSYTTRTSSYGRQSLGAFSSDEYQENPSSPLTPLSERSVSKSPILSRIRHFESSPRVSPWNYRMIGGVRKVPKTPDVKQKQPETSSTSTPEGSLPSLPEIELTNPLDLPSTQLLNEKPSFQSTISYQSKSTLSERTNYKIYAQSSPIAVADLTSLPASSIHSNYEVLGASSAEPSVQDNTRPHTRESDANYVVLGGTSVGSSVVAVKDRLKNEFSQESLVVPPLRPTKKRSWESFGLVKTRSHDSLRTGSLTSISSIITQEATRALFVGPPTMLQQVGPSWHSSPGFPKTPNNPRPPHWSSQLSTVLSESEPGSEPASRALSVTSLGDRRSSSHSKHILNMVNSLAGLEEQYEGPSHSRTPSLEPPAPALNRNALREPNLNTLRLIRDQDEDGDGLADLEVLRHRPSRTRIGKMMLSSYASDRSLRSTASFNAALPTWAKVYYGSGERKWLAYKPSSESMFSNFSYTDSQAGGVSRSPSQRERFVSGLFGSFRRPQNPVGEHGGHREPQSEPSLDDLRPLESNPMTSPLMQVVRSLKKQTSSIWSPHLARDRRAIEHTLWEPPMTIWETKSDLTGKRNTQVVMLVLGFIFPFAWMIAAMLPISMEPQTHDLEQGHTTSNEDLRQARNNKKQLVNEEMYLGAIWWRNVNRGMSFIGLLVLGAVIALIVVGTKQRWGS